MDVGGRESGSSAAPAAQIAARESSLVRIKCFSPLKAGWVGAESTASAWAGMGGNERRRGKNDAIWEGEEGHR